MSIRALAAVCICGALLSPVCAEAADRVELLNGTVLKGQVLREDAKGITVRLDFGAEIRVSMSRVHKVTINGRPARMIRARHSWRPQRASGGQDASRRKSQMRNRDRNGKPPKTLADVLKEDVASKIIALGHPRLVMTSSHVAALKKRVKTDPSVKKLLDQARRDALRGKGWDSGLSAAVVYALTGEKSFAQIAKKMLLKSPRYGGYGNGLYEGAWAYDLIFPALSRDEIKTYHSAILPRSDEGFLLKDRMGAMNLSAIVALIGDGVEDDVLRKRLVFMLRWLQDQTIPFMERVADRRGGTWQSLGGCACARHKYGEWLCTLSNTLGVDFYDAPYHYMSQLYFYHSFIILPGLRKWPGPETGHQDTRFGANRTPSGPYDIWSRQSSNHPVIASKSRSGLARWFTEQSEKPSRSAKTYPAWMELVGWWDRGLAEVHPRELPLDCCFKGMGWAVGRSGWGADDVYVLFISGIHTQGSGHSDLWQRNNQFLIYNGQKRAINFGEYLEPKISASKLNANPAAPQLKRPPGFRYGKKAKTFIQGKILSYESTPEYLYVCGDASLDYSGKVKFLRHLIYIRPGSFLIYDSISPVNGWNKTAPPGVSFAKTLLEQTGSSGKLLHFFQVAGKKASVKSSGSSVTVTIPETGRTIRFQFKASGEPGGRVSVSGGKGGSVDRELATSVEDDWRHWKNHPRFKRGGPTRGSVS